MNIMSFDTGKMVFNSQEDCEKNQRIEMFKQRETGILFFHDLGKDVFGKTDEPCNLSILDFALVYTENKWHQIAPSRYAEVVLDEMGHTQMKCLTNGKTLRFYIDETLIRISKRTYEFSAFHRCPVNTKFSPGDIRAYFTFHSRADLAKPSPYNFRGITDRVLHVQDIDYGC